MAPSDEDILQELSALERRSAGLLGQGNGLAAESWEDLERSLELQPMVSDLGLRAPDHFASVFAGLAGGILDLRPAIADALTSEEMHQQLDGAFKERLREATGKSGTIAIDNAVGGPDHRLVGPTHDVFRLFKTVKLVREGRFESAVKGVSKEAASYRRGLPPYLKVDDPKEALILVIMHWAADFFSSRSLPLPGWSRLAEVDNREFVSWLFKVYREGANLRTAISQFASNLSGLTLISILLHVYRYIDLFWITERAEFSASRLIMRQDLRFRWMSRNANLTALAVTTGNVAITRNIFSWNYLALIKFFADARAVESLLGDRHAELDKRTELLLRELEAG